MLDVQEYIPSLYRKLWQALGLKFSDPKDYYACEDESYRQLTDIFRKMSRDLEKAPVEAFSAASGSPIDRFADKIKGAVLDVSQDDRTTRTEKAIDSIFGAIKKSIRDAVAAEKAKTDKRNSFLDKVVGALDHVVTDVPAAPLPMGIGDRIARNYKKIFDVFVPPHFRKQAIYIFNKQPQFGILQCGHYRPTARDPHRRTLDCNRIYRIFESYFYMQYYNCDMVAYMKASNSINMPYSQRADSREYDYIEWHLSPLAAGSDLIAAAIDMNEPGVVGYIKHLFEDDCYDALSRDIVCGIVKSDNLELLNLLISLLLDAGLQEGVRQVICENMDIGTIQSQIAIFRAIYDNNLIRYSSVKRALATQTGVGFDKDNLERSFAKLNQCMHEVIETPAICHNYIRSDDPYLVKMGFWGLAIRDVKECIEHVQSILENGTREQIIATAHNIFVINDPGQLSSFAKYIFDHYADDRNIVGAWFYSFINDVYDIADEALYSKGPNVVHPIYRKISFRCAPIPLEPYFDSPDEVRKYFDLLRKFLGFVQKESVGTMASEPIYYRMFVMAWMLRDSDLLSELAPKFTEAGFYWQRDTLLMATWNPKTHVQKKVLFEAAVSRTDEISDRAQEIMKYVSLRDEDYDELRELFRLKSIGARNYLSDLFYNAPESTMLSQIAEMLKSKKKDIRSAGIDLIVRLKNDEKRRDAYAKARNLIQILASPSDAEKVMIEGILGQNEVDIILNTPGYGLYNPDIKTPLPPFKYQKYAFRRCIEHWMNSVPLVLRKLDVLIDFNKDREYQSGEATFVLGKDFRRIDYDVNDRLLGYPFPELWQQFYEEEIGEFGLLLVTRCLIASRLNRRFDGAREYFGLDLSGISYPKLKFENTVEDIIENLFDYYVQQNLPVIVDLFGSIAYAIVAKPFRSNFEIDEEKIRNKGRNESIVFPNLVIPIFGVYRNLCWMDGLNYFITLETLNRYFGSNVAEFSIIDYLLAYQSKLISRDEVYQMIFEGDSRQPPGLSFRLMAPFISEKPILLGYDARAAVRKFFDAPDGSSFWKLPINKSVQEVYWPLVDMILKVELKRSEQSTIFSQYIPKIPAVRGTQVLVDLLIALNGARLDRDAYYHLSWNESKSYCLSCLLQVSEPALGEDAETLRECLKEHSISDERLIEVAMFNDHWIPIIEAYLGWKGLAKGIYYFAAHMDEDLSERQQSIIARYTPIPIEDLNHGAMDIRWFREAYDLLGEDHFNLLYQSAKYLAASNKHTRARKYADAMNGKFDIKETEREIKDKRNKDLLMAYGLIPLKDQDDIAHRYAFIQDFRKESKSFGGQRQASEAIAADMAIRNLASNAGVEDETRFIMRMEAQITDSLDKFFSWTALGDDIELRIAQSDEDYSLSIECQKSGKPLKSVPSKYKKDPTVISFREALKSLREQFSRTKRMCEEFMENGTELTIDELQLLLGNRIAGPVLSKIVYLLGDKSIHYFEHAFDNPQGIKFRLSADAKLRIAHPYDLYKNGDWAFYQKYIFDHQIKQPFRQVFRELYLLTDEEREMIYSLRFAGNQIKTRQTVGCLKGRRWGASYEDGLQKIYYRENIIATIYAEADWFSPSDIEPPTLEYVVFFDRETHEELELQEVPPIIFSEVMRDVDMAVSVAHAGDVDPETSHSTIEMRRIIAEYNAQLFGYKNVSFDERHAKIEGKRASYTIHLGSGTIFKVGGSHIAVLPVHSQHKGRLFLPFIDEDPKTAEIMSKILLFANDMKIKDPYILRQL